MKDREEVKKQENVSEKKYYWAKAADYHLDNLVPERKSEAGHIIQDAIPLIFGEHIHVTSDPKEIKHIEDSGAFRAGRIVRCDNHEELIARTEMHKNQRAGVVEVENIMTKDVYSQHEVGA